MPKDDRDDDKVEKFPAQFDAARAGAQKRLAQQFMVQMPKDPREQRQIVRYMIELIDWHETNGNGGKTKG